MKKKYDLIIIGAGLSSLMFLNQYLKKTSEQKILLLEQKDKINSDQTFCVWEGPGLPSISENFQLKPKKIWNNIVLNSLNDQIKRHVKPYSYVCFDGKETLESLLSTCKEKIKVIKNELLPSWSMILKTIRGGNMTKWSFCLVVGRQY